MKMTLRAMAVVVLGTSSLFLTGCKKQEAAAQPPPAEVTVSEPVKREVVEWDAYPSRLEAVDAVEVRSRVTGHLQSIHFKDGSEVKKGDLLFVVDPRPYESELGRLKAEVERAEARLQLTKNEAERAERLIESKTISVEEADTRRKAKIEAQAALNAAKASMNAARLNVEFSQIKAPIGGRISRKMITEGNLVNGDQGQSTLLTTIVSIDPIYSYFDVDEQAALRYQQLLREGNISIGGEKKIPAELELGNETGYPHKGYVDFIENRVDEKTGTLRVRAVFPNPGPDRVLQPGFFARVRIPGSAAYKALMIMDAAVGTDQSQKFVYTLSSSNTVAYTPVKLGPVIDGLRVVREGLSADSIVLINGLMKVRPGAPVTPKHESMDGKPTEQLAESNP